MLTPNWYLQIQALHKLKNYCFNLKLQKLSWIQYLFNNI